MDYVALALVVAAFAALAYVVQPRPRFVIFMRPGEPLKLRGPVPREFVEYVRELRDELKIEEGDVRGFESGKRIVLDFSRSLPTAFCQRARNIWANRRT